MIHWVNRKSGAEAPRRGNGSQTEAMRPARPALADDEGDERSGQDEREVAHRGRQEVARPGDQNADGDGREHEPEDPHLQVGQVLSLDGVAGRGPGRDVMSGIAEILKRPYVDKKRKAVTGWSYSGYMTTWLLGNYPDEWRALLLQTGGRCTTSQTPM